ncbi:MAG: acyl carrier protein [Muribaculaceae bacterium]|nr:acyl carrier protein [Muribaculaceae bacterium]
MEEKIINTIASILEVEPSEIELDTAVGDLPEWDSMHHIQIIAALEKAYGIKYAAEDLAEIEDVADLISLTQETIG